VVVVAVLAAITMAITQVSVAAEQVAAETEVIRERVLAVGRTLVAAAAAVRTQPMVVLAVQVS